MNKKWIKYIIGIPLFVLGAMFSHYEQDVLATITFLIAAVTELLLCYHESKLLFDLRNLLSLSWLGGIGLACLKLSNLQENWIISTWVSFGLFYFGFLAAYDIFIALYDRKHGEGSAMGGSNLLGAGVTSQSQEMFGTNRVVKQGRFFTTTSHEVFVKRIRQMIIFVFVVGVGMFVLEALILGFIPLFSEESHAYTDFHITGLHYFTCSVMLMHPLSVIYAFQKKLEKKEAIFLIIINLIGLSVPVLCLSKFQILIAVALPVITWVFLMQRRISTKKMLACMAVLLVLVCAAFAVIVIGRNYPDGYLQEIFHMKDSNMPVAIQYPYMYVVNNFENFNLTAVNITSFTFGTRQLFPVFALTGLKFLPALAPLLQYPVFVTEPSLTTVTILLDAYGDFGMFGCLIFGLILGGFSAWLTHKVVGEKKILAMLFYGQFAVYFALSFFSTWFSVPTTWFWFVATALIYFYCSRQRNSVVKAKARGN